MGCRGLIVLVAHTFQSQNVEKPLCALSCPVWTIVSGGGHISKLRFSCPRVSANLVTYRIYVTHCKQETCWYNRSPYHACLPLSFYCRVVCFKVFCWQFSHHSGFPNSPFQLPNPHSNKFLQGSQFLRCAPGIALTVPRCDSCSDSALPKPLWIHCLATVASLLNMAPKKRKVSQANVEQQSQKVDRQLKKVVEGNAALAFQSDLDWVQQQLSLAPHKMDAVKAALSMKGDTGYDAKLSFHPCLTGKGIHKLPCKYLMDELLPALQGTPSAEALASLVRVDPKACLKILQRACAVSSNMAIGTLSKEAFKQRVVARIAVMRYDFATLKIDAGNVINWNWPLCGHYSFQPPCELEPDREHEHVYTHLRFMNHDFPFDADMPTVRGSWRINHNWSVLEACTYLPEKPWMRTPCHTLVAKTLLNDLVPPKAKLLLEATPLATASSVASRECNLSCPAPSTMEPFLPGVTPPKAPPQVQAAQARLQASQAASD